MTIHRVGGETEVYEAPAIPYQAHQHLFDEFLNWLDGGKPLTHGLRITSKVSSWSSLQWKQRLMDNRNRSLTISTI